MSSAKKNQTTNGSCSQSIINRVFILFTWTHYHQYIQGHLFEESCGFLNHSFSLDNDLLSRKCGYIFFLFLLCIHCFYRFDIFIFNRGLSNGIHCGFSYCNQSRNLCFLVYQNSCYTSGISCVTLGQIWWQVMKEIFRNHSNMMATVNRSKSDDFNLTLGSLAFLLAATLYKKKSWWEPQSLEYHINW